jgi:hypothetical protein
MNVAEALHAARAAGITLALDGEAILLEAAAEPPQAILDALAGHKREILDLLRPEQCGWTREQWRAYFNKRCEIAAANSRRACAQAEMLALTCCITEWLNQHPAPSAPGRCVRCGRPESRGAVILPFGTDPGTHTWLHAECWPAWHDARRADAMEALLAMGIRAWG